MRKREVLKALQVILQKESHNSEATTAVEYLQSIVREWEDRSSSNMQKSDILPLPREIKAGDFALFSDGASRGNPGPGAWGALAQNSSGLLLWEASGVDTLTTNNKMELQGAIEALKWLLDNATAVGFTVSKNRVFLYSDSKYVVDGITSWMPGWKRRGWKKADKKVPENLHLWQEIDELVAQFTHLQLCWVKGHAGHPQNERCDTLANLALDESGF